MAHDQEIRQSMEQSEILDFHSGKNNPVVRFMIGGAYTKLINILNEFELDRELEIELNQVKYVFESLMDSHLPGDLKGQYDCINEVLATLGQELLKLFEIKGLASADGSGFIEDLQSVEQELYLTINSLHIRRGYMRRSLNIRAH